MRNYFRRGKCTYSESVSNISSWGVFWVTTLRSVVVTT